MIRDGIFRKADGSDTGNCVEVAAMPEGGVRVRDSKHRDGGTPWLHRHRMVGVRGGGQARRVGPTRVTIANQRQSGPRPSGPGPAFVPAIVSASGKASGSACFHAGDAATLPGIYPWKGRYSDAGYVRQPQRRGR
jgi:Domain of unknown function (DUF397)